MTEPLNLSRSQELFEEGLDLIPGAILGIRRPYNFVPGEYPIFFDSATGGRVTDVDGNNYIDMLCAYGPIILGHREAEVDDAVIDQIRNRGFCMSLTQPVQNQLARKLRELIPSCDQAVFTKTGSDATTASIRVARAYTERTKILRCGYHGWHDWCVEVKGGVPKKLYEDIHEFTYNRIDQVRSLFEEHRSQVAAVILTPLGHPLAQPLEYPKPGFLEEVRDLCTSNGAVLIFDEVRTGFRVHLGGAQSLFDVIPDLSVFGKAMANGYPIGAVVGKREIMEVLASGAFLSSTFFPNSESQVAALKTIEILQRDKVLDQIAEKGSLFCERIQGFIDSGEVPCELSGGPWMPFITFNKDSSGLYKKLRTEFYTQLIRKKVFLQPFHHGYIAYRHTDEDLNYASEM
ncbi:aminotransferase class III-fold pyridoxal phosphate-dependent enzyme, partial [bacterium]|nr:aminotransferase class III-fold pyridoxal phosphate-dependent enzyme [bacterium]